MAPFELPEFDPSLESLFRAAADAARHAYCPYSNFAVGAAVRLGSGLEFSGCNVENMSYPVGVCAERNTIGASIRGRDTLSDVVEVMVLLAFKDGRPAECSPCGACRQALAEENTAGLVHFLGPDLSVITQSVSQLLPFHFHL
jgi:cytidine deaminase